MWTLRRSEPIRPVARTENLLVEEVEGEVVLYDLDRDKAHCLNGAAAEVWRLCDGERTPKEMAEAMDDGGNGLAEDVVWQGLSQLHRKGLLASPQRLPQHISRRELVQKASLWTAAGVLAIPTIKSIVAPTPAHAASLAPDTCCQYQSCTDTQVGCQTCVSGGAGSMAVCPPSVTIGANTCTQLVNALPTNCSLPLPCPSACAPI